MPGVAHPKSCENEARPQANHKGGFNAIRKQMGAQRVDQLDNQGELQHKTDPKQAQGRQPNIHEAEARHPQAREVYGRAQEQACEAGILKNACSADNQTSVNQVQQRRPQNMK